MKVSVVFFSFLLCFGILIAFQSFQHYSGLNILMANFSSVLYPVISTSNSTSPGDQSTTTDRYNQFYHADGRYGRNQSDWNNNLPLIFDSKLSETNISNTVFGRGHVVESDTNLTDRSDSNSNRKDPIPELSLSNLSPCAYDFKVYVYDISGSIPSVRFGAEARINQTLHVCKKCILEQFALEYILNDFFTQFCGRTYNPEEADFFYLPLVRDAEYRHTLDSKSLSKRQPSAAEQALLDILEKGDSSKWIKVFNITDQHWIAHGGSNHIFAMAAPVTNFRHETSKRGFFHYMSHLHPPIFLGVEYSLSFVTEYPVCSTQKNIVLPYPTTDPDLFNGKLHADFINRTALLYYAGGMHGDCVEVRRAMKFLVRNSTSIPGILPDVKSVQAEREHGFRAATFCPIPVGDSPSSKRMYDVLNFGCIPVVLSDDLVWAFSHQTGGPLDPRAFSIQMPQAVVQFPAEIILRKYNTSRALLGLLPDRSLLYNLLEDSHATGGSLRNGLYVNSLVQILSGISEENIRALRAGVAVAAPKYRYFLNDPSMRNIPTSSNMFPSGGATEMLALQLSQRKALGVDKIGALCREERARTHRYVDRFPCDYSMRK